MIAALTFCRFLHIGAAMLVFGASAFVRALVPAELASTLAPAITRRAFVLAWVIAVTSVLWLALEAGEMSDAWAGVLDPRTVRDVLFDTTFGRAWQVHLLLVAGLVATSRLRAAHRLGPVALLSALVLVSLGLVGHATMQSGALGWAHRACHGLHLLAAGAWLGGLVPLLSVMRSLDVAQHRGHAAAALRNFSQAGHWVVALVVITGAADTMFVLGRLPLSPSSPYAALLLGKTALVALMVAVAVVNRYRLVPRMGASPVSVRAWLRRNTIMEVVLGTAVLVLSSALSSLDPQ